MKQGWEVKKLGEVLLKTETVDPTKRPDGEFIYVDVSSVNNKGFFVESTTTLMGKDAPSRAKKLIRTNDVIFATVRPTLKRIAIIGEQLDKQICSTGYFVLRPNNFIHYKLLFYYLLTDNFTAKMESLQKGASYPAVTDNEVRNQLISYPKSVHEQQRIVSILDGAFAAIAKAKANAEQNLKNAKELFESYLKNIFESRRGWEEKTLSQISENLDSKRIPITKNIRNEGLIPYYGASGIVDYVANYIFDEDLLCVSEDGANLLARTYPIAFSISGKTWVNNHAHVLRFKNNITQKFVEIYLNSIKLDDFVSGMAQPKLNQAMLNKIPIPFPPLFEQISIVQKIDSLSAKAKNLAIIYQQKINDLEELKKTILQKAFNGELSTNLSKATVIGFSITIPNISPTDLHAGIIALALQQHDRGKRIDTFHHVKAEKTVHLVEAYLGISLERNPVKDAAGPNDFPRTKIIESRAAKAGFFTVTKQEGLYVYNAGRQFGKLIDKVKLALGAEAEKVTALIDLMVPITTQQAEIIATVFAAWNNLLLDNQPITDEAIVFEARENWHQDKSKIPREKFFNAIAWMKEKGIVPIGRGKKVAKPSKK